MAIRDDSLDDFAKLIWGKRSEGLPVPELDIKREISPQELKNLHLRFAFVQILNPESTGEFSEIHSVKSKSGWVILNYGNAMAASPGEMLFSHGEYEQAEEATEEAEEGSLQRVCSGTGTVVMQIVNTAADMVRIAKDELHWPSINIVNGHPLMTFAIWKACQDLNIPVNYDPTKDEEAKYQRILKNCPKTLVIQPEPLGVKP